VTTDLFEESKTRGNIVSVFKTYCADIEAMNLEARVETINALREMLHEISPFKTEPVDFVKWVRNPLVHANDYNPNSVAPPEM
jgi:hypothetical protein